MRHFPIKLSLFLLFTVCGLSYADDTLQIKHPDVTVSLMYQAIDSPETRQRLSQKVAHSVDIIRRYYGHFPVTAVSINFAGSAGSGVKNGRIFQGKEAPIILLQAGQTLTEKEFQDDWIVTHEILHTALADLPDQHHWLEEGLPTYLEPIVKAQAGDTSAEIVWKYFYQRMHQGQPEDGDRGLDNTPTWGRTYWGGAAFLLFADVAIRKKSNNRASLKDALKNLNNAGLTLNRDASIEEVLKHMDNTLAGPVVSTLYNKHAETPTPFALEKLWFDLGISINPTTQGIVFNNDAPLSNIRRAMTQ